MTGGALTAGRAAARSGLAGWRMHGVALAATICAIMVIFRADAAAMARIWWGTSTYEHCLAVVPVLAWLVWVRRAMLARVTPRGWVLPLLWVAAGAVGWLVGHAAGVAAARHLALVMMLQGAVAAIVGRAATVVLAFPLGYALFLVPFGDGLMPALQTFTARMCLALLHLARVSATIDGVFITTPGGWFEVAEACSGAKFLVAMAALGVLVAHLGFVSWVKRAVFLALCLVAPVLANGVRAFATIWVAQRVGAARAGSFDHIVYGWFFFGAVIATVLALAWHFFDRPADAAPADPAAVARAEARPGRGLPLPVAVAAVLAIALAAPGRAVLARGGDATIAADARLPDVPGWTRLPPAGDWMPRYADADRLLRARYRAADGATVDVAAALYAAQDERHELVGFGHGAAGETWLWTAAVPAPAGWRAERLAGPAAAMREAWTSYRVGGATLAGPARVKLATLRVHLLGGDRRASALIVFAPDRAAIARFAAALGDPGAALAKAGG